MPALVQSDATGLNRDKILDDTFWCVYCCCEGCGLGPVKEPALCASEMKNLCVHSTCVTADIMADDGLCGCVAVEGAMTSQCQLPPLANAPKCLCCNIPLAPGNPSGKDPQGIFDYSTIFGGTWWTIYCGCCGYGLNGLQAGGRPIFAMTEKCLICRGSVALEDNNWPGAGKGMTGCKQGTCIEGDDVCGSGFGKNLCCVGQMQLPPAPKAPLIAICGKKLGGFTSEKFGK
jgi:hypothetical protein